MVSWIECASFGGDFWFFCCFFFCLCGFVMREIAPFHYLEFPGVVLMEPVIVSIKTEIGPQVSC